MAYKYSAWEGLIIFIATVLETALRAYNLRKFIEREKIAMNIETKEFW